MIIFASILIASAIVLVVYSLNSEDAKDARRKAKEKAQARATEKRIVNLTEKSQSLKEKVFGYKTEVAALEKVKACSSTMEKELESLRKKEAELQEQNKQNKKWLIHQQELLKNEKNPAKDSRKKLLDKERQLDQEFTKNVNLKREISEVQRETKIREKDIKALNDEKRALEKRIKDTDQRMVKVVGDLRAQKEEVAKLKKKEKESEWVSKQDYNDLLEQSEESKQQAENRKKEVELKDKEIEKKDKERMRLAHQLKEQG